MIRGLLISLILKVIKSILELLVRWYLIFWSTQPRKPQKLVPNEIDETTVASDNQNIIKAEVQSVRLNEECNRLPIYIFQTTLSSITTLDPIIHITMDIVLPNGIYH